MRLSLIFGLLCIICLGVYATMFAIMSSTPALALGLSWIMILSGWGAGAFFILALVMFVLHI